MGKIFNIQRFCTSDGNGIRTTVFFKGCPLRCLWCHNPESQGMASELAYDAKKCVSCQRCVSLCRRGCHMVGDTHLFDRTACKACGECLSPLCTALELYGKEVTAEEVLAEVERDKAFYDSSGGGMTLSGGEPLYQPDFCIELLRLAHERGIDTCVETCGFAQKDIIIKTAPFVDTYLFDIKETDSQRHREYTGTDNSLIIENLYLLDSLKKNIILRCPIIPSLNDRAEHFKGIGELAERLASVSKIEVEPYHSFGEGKYERLGREYAVMGVASPTDEAVIIYVNSIKKYTSKRVERA